MKSLKLAPNLSTLFSDLSIQNRLASIRKLSDSFKEKFGMSFDRVEMQFPYEYDLKMVKEACQSNSLKFILINTIKGLENDPQKDSSLGYGCLSQQNNFKTSLELAIKYATTLGAKYIHIMAGMQPQDITLQEAKNNYISNLKLASTMLRDHDLIGVIEPLCKEVKDGYFLNSFVKAVDYLEEIGRDNIRLLLDVFHLEMIHGNVTKESIQKYLKHAAYVQVSQAPRRSEPYSTGYIDFDMVFRTLLEHYDGYVGLEYFPTGDSEASLMDWIPKYMETFNKFE